VKPPIESIDVSCDELIILLDGARAALGEAGYQKLQAAIRTLGYVTELLQNQEATLASLRRLLCHASTEKTSKVLKQAGIESSDKPQPPAPPAAKRATAGHGRNSAAAYRGPRKVAVPHASLKAGGPCPDARCRGKVYPRRDPGVLVRVKGQAPLAATAYELEKLRCNLCGDVYTAAAPEGVGEKKYDETAASMIALLRYGSGVPWYRLQGLEKSLGIPLPVATQCEIVAETAVILQPVQQELMRQAAQGEVVHNDDTSNTRAVAGPGCGHFPGADRRIHQRARMDLPGAADRVVLHWVQARRREPGRGAEAAAHRPGASVEVTASFPDQCRFVLETLGEVYGYDDRTQSMSPEQRLHFHQEHSGPVMEKLHAWLGAQFAERKVEPNSGLGKAISYLLNHWEKLTLFLREPGAPLDNNIVERALKKSILHRKNSLFYKNRNGAKMGDLFMSLIHTCELNRVNPFDYLSELQRHAEELKQTPSEWMPWNYRETLARTGALLDAA
jgi:transposase